MKQEKGYTKMKDSGADWIGKIPVTWGVSKIGSLYTQRNEKVSDKDYPPLSVTMKGVLPQLATAAKSDDGDNRKLVRVGDFAINSRSDRRGSCGISPYDGSVSLINTILIPRKKMHPGYYNWLFHTTLFADEFYKWGHGIVDDLWTTRWQEMKRILVPVPPYETQSAIASYLDTQCAKIDEIIAQAKASIEDYKQWKASIIYEAVTKGLDPNVEMKESGIPWIGKVPKSWACCKQKYVMQLINGRAYKDDEFETEGKYRVLRVGNLFSNPKWYYSNLELEEDKYCDNGDLLYAWSMSYGPVIWNGERVIYHYHIWKTKLSKELTTQFAYYYLIALSNNIKAESHATTMGFVTMKTMNNSYVVFPSLDEQSAITTYLDTQCAKIDELVSEKQSFIDDLESYKKSLIYEVVTGKKRVVEPTMMTLSMFSSDILLYQKALVMLRVLDLLGPSVRGRIHLQKCMYTSECLLNMSFQTQYVRYEHGPYDPNLLNLESILKNNGWFTIQNSSPVKYQKGEQFVEGLKEYMEIFSGIDKKLKRIIDFLKPMKSSQAERVATLLAAWNDFILEGINPTDEEIIGDVMTNWTPNKANSQYSTWQDTLNKIRENHFIPTGSGLHTIKKEIQAQEELKCPITKSNLNRTSNPS